MSCQPPHRGQLRASRRVLVIIYANIFWRRAMGELINHYIQRVTICTSVFQFQTFIFRPFSSRSLSSTRPSNSFGEHLCYTNSLIMCLGVCMCVGSAWAFVSASNMPNDAIDACLSFFRFYVFSYLTGVIW